jgi:hypothetical protein
MYEDNDDGLPDEAFTEDELAAGVQHLARGTFPPTFGDQGSPSQLRYSRRRRLEQETGVPNNGWSRGLLKTPNDNEFTNLAFFFDELGYCVPGDLDVERLRTLLAFANQGQVTSLHRMIEFYAEPKQSLYGRWRYAWDARRFPHLAGVLFDALRERDLRVIAHEVKAALAQYSGEDN